MDFPYYQNYQGPVMEAYEKTLIDCIQGDHTLFWRQDAVELAWSYLSPVIEECETCADLAKLVQFYPAGSWGPAAAESWCLFPSPIDTSLPIPSVAPITRPGHTCARPNSPVAPDTPIRNKGRLTVPSGPGLGIHVDEARLGKPVVTVK